MLIFPALTIAVLAQVAAARADSPPVLYAIENINSARGAETRNLVRLSIDRENKLVKQTLLSKDQRFFGHFGGHRVALGRFIVTHYGGVIDIEARKVINDEQDGKLLGLDGTKVFYRIDNSFRTSGLFCFDLIERKVTKIESGGQWDLPGLKSADKTMSIETNRSYEGMIRLHQLGKAPRDLVKDARIAYSRFASPDWSGRTCLWLDAGHILAGQTNGTLVILTTQGTVEATIEIKDAPAEVLSRPSLWHDPLGKVIYSCGGKDFLLDIPNRSAGPLTSHTMGHGFEASVEVDKQRRRSLSHDGKVIGQWTFSPFEAEVAPGYLAFPYARPSEDANLGEPDGIAVWNARSGDWQTVEIWVNDLIGWSN